MIKISKNKLFVFLVLFAVSLLAWAAAKRVDAMSGKLTAVDNVVVVQKQIYKFTDGGKNELGIQKHCRESKAIRFEMTGNSMYAPLPEDTSTLEDVRKLQDITITEYYSGKNYAKYTTGHERSRDQKYSWVNGATVEFDCSIKSAAVNKVVIETADNQYEYSQYDNKQTTNRIDPIRSNDKKSLPKLHKDLIVYKIPNSKQECLVSESLLVGSCLFKDSPVHIGTARKLSIHTIPFPEDAADNEPVKYLVTDASNPYRNKYIAKTEVFVSVEVDKAIPASVFKIPN